MLIPLLIAGLACNKNKDPKPDTSGKFKKFYGTAGMNQAYTLTEVSDGFILSGYSIKDSRTDKDILIIKADQNGNKVWERRIETGKDEIARDLTVQNGEILITGMQIQANGFSQAFFISLNSSGQVIDERKFGRDSVNEDAYHISKLAGGDFLVGGIRDSAGNKNMYLTRIAPDSVVWEFNIGSVDQDDALNRVIQVDNGDLLWCGTAARSAGSNIRCVLSTSSGTVKWSYEYDINSSDEYGRNIEQTSDGNFIIAGSRGKEGTGNENLLLVKINSNGYKDWESRPVSGKSGGYSIKRVSTGGYIVAGFKQVDNATDQLLLRVNEGGSTTWERTYGGSRNDQGRYAIECSDGFFAMSGYVDLFDDKNNVFQLVKVDSNGEINEKR
jgi:hypothetical protein